MEDIGKLKKGFKIKINNYPCLVTSFSFHKPGKGQGVYRCKLKNLVMGNSFDQTWRSGDKFEKAELSEKKVNFSYIDGEEYVFVDQEYEQIFLDKKFLKGQEILLEDDTECKLLYFEGKLIEVELANFVEHKIVYTEPGFKGNSASTSVLKSAKIQNDYELEVPLFIEIGDCVKVDTRTGKYVERVNKK